MTARTVALKPSLIHVDGYPAYGVDASDTPQDTTTDEYASAQCESNAKKTLDYIVPLIDRCDAHSILDVGCGIGTMVRTLLDSGYDAYGTDLAGLTRFWSQQNHPTERFSVVGPIDLELPFDDCSLDFVFSLGAIEHVGTSDGHASRLPQYQLIRRNWLREIFRTVRSGGWMLIGGPNRGFPIDVAHGPDCAATSIERHLSRIAGATVHKTWGEGFLWSYSDVSRYLSGLPHVVHPISIDRLLGFSRVPPLVRPLVESYVRYLPARLLGTGFNPWMMALIQKTAAR
jgi:SAM-dependent methyltransferase